MTLATMNGSDGINYPLITQSDAFLAFSQLSALGKSQHGGQGHAHIYTYVATGIEFCLSL